jgi:sugar lactone lactonase YvrE
MNQTRSVDELRTVVSGIDHPEGIAWHENALWCGTESGDLLRIDVDSGAVEVVAQTGGFLLGLAFDHAGRCIACDLGRGQVLRITPGGEVEVLADSISGQKLHSPNFPVITPTGDILVSESGTGWGTDDGYLFVIRPDGSSEGIADDCRRFPNGLALTTEADVVYVVESRLPGIVSYAIDGSSLGVRTVHTLLPGTVPDGLAFDRSGTLYISCWRPDRVYCISAEGESSILLDDPTGEYLTTPTNLCFGSANLDRLYFAGLGGWAIKELEMSVTGQVLPLVGADG